MSRTSRDGAIRVLWISKGLGPGGAERLLLSFAAAADHTTFAFHAAFVLRRKSQLAAPLESAGVVTTCLGVDRLTDLRWVTRLRRLLRDGEFDVVHTHSPLAGAICRAVVATTRPRPRLVSTEHNVWSSFHPLTRALDRATARLDDHAFAVSGAVRASLPARMAARSEVLLHGVAVADIDRRRAERDQRRAQLGVTGARVVATVANLRHDKDYPNLFAAAQQVLSTVPDVVFLSVGQGPLEHELRADLERRGLGDRFRMLGHQADPVGHLVAADLFVLASRHEGLPVALLEALAAGLPVVATAVGGIPDVITDGCEGRLVPPGDPVRLADAIVHLLAPARAAAAGASARRRAGAFDIARAVDRQQAVYAQLAQVRR